MVPFGLSKEQFEAAYLASLNGSAGSLIETLRDVLALPVPETVNSAEVQIFMGDDGLSAPEAWIYYRGRNNRVDHKDPTIFPGRAMSLPLNVTTHDEFDEEYILSSEFGGLAVAARTLKKWFAACWFEAGGQKYKIPVTLHVHDGLDGGSGVAITAHR